MSFDLEIAVLDACVLYPADIRDLLLYLAEYDLYDPRWTDEILRERERVLGKRRMDLTPAQIKSATIAMTDAFPHALIEIDPLMTKHLKLPDMNDVHVLAGAVSCGASTM